MYTPKGSHGAYGALAMATTMGTMKSHGGKNQSQGILITIIYTDKILSERPPPKPKKTKPKKKKETKKINNVPNS